MGNWLGQDGRPGAQPFVSLKLKLDFSIPSTPHSPALTADGSPPTRKQGRSDDTRLLAWTASTDCPGDLAAEPTARPFAADKWATAKGSAMFSLFFARFFHPSAFLLHPLVAAAAHQRSTGDAESTSYPAESVTRRASPLNGADGYR